MKRKEERRGEEINRWEDMREERRGADERRVMRGVK